MLAMSCLFGKGMEGYDIRKLILNKLRETGGIFECNNLKNNSLALYWLGWRVFNNN